MTFTCVAVFNKFIKTTSLLFILTFLPASKYSHWLPYWSHLLLPPPHSSYMLILMFICNEWALCFFFFFYVAAFHSTHCTCTCGTWPEEQRGPQVPEGAIPNTSYASFSQIPIPEHKTLLLFKGMFKSHTDPLLTFLAVDLMQMYTDITPVSFDT